MLSLISTGIVSPSLVHGICAFLISIVSIVLLSQYPCTDLTTLASVQSILCWLFITWIAMPLLRSLPNCAAFTQALIEAKIIVQHLCSIHYLTVQKLENNDLVCNSTFVLQVLVVPPSYFVLEYLVYHVFMMFTGLIWLIILLLHTLHSVLSGSVLVSQYWLSQNLPSFDCRHPSSSSLNSWHAPWLTINCGDQSLQPKWKCFEWALHKLIQNNSI